MRIQDFIDAASRGTEVRYEEATGWSEWIECRKVEFRGSWLVITLPGDEGDTLGTIAVPDHVVRGRVEVRLA